MMRDYSELARDLRRCLKAVLPKEDTNDGKVD